MIEKSYVLTEEQMAEVEEVIEELSAPFRLISDVVMENTTFDVRRGCVF